MLAHLFQYWPVNLGGVMEFPDVHLKLEHVDSVPGEHYTVRTLRYSSLRLGVNLGLELN